MNRIFDLIAVVITAIVVLLPKASVEARPALAADPLDLARVAALEEGLAQQADGSPGREAVADDLAEMYLRLERPDWALVTLSASSPESASARTWLLRATAHAERLEAKLAVDATEAGRRACDRAGCAPQVRARLDLIAAPMQALVDGKIDPRTDPQRAKEAVGKALHSTRPMPPSAPGKK